MPLYANEPLTDRNTFDELRKHTCPGQAHWGGTGPAGKTCRECSHWCTFPNLADYGPYGLKPRRCDRFIELMRGTKYSAPKVPHSALACREFKPADQPPPVFR